MPSQLTSTCTLCTQDAFVLGKDYSMQFYANINNVGNSVGPSRVTYTISTSGTDLGTLVEKVQVPDSATPTATGYVYCNAEIAGATAACKARLSTRTLAVGVKTNTGVPVFAYYDGVGGSHDPDAGYRIADLDPAVPGALGRAHLDGADAERHPCSSDHVHPASDPAERASDPAAERGEPEPVNRLRRSTGRR